MSFCHSCGSPLQAQETFCGACGSGRVAELPAEMPASPRAVQPSPPGIPPRPGGQPHLGTPAARPSNNSALLIGGAIVLAGLLIGGGFLVSRLLGDNSGGVTAGPSPTAAQTALAPVTPTASIASPDATVIVPGTASPEVSATPTTAITTVSTQFVSPTGNLTCSMSDDYATCEIRERDYVAAAPASCDLDWGARVEVSDGAARMVCHGDTMNGMANVDTVESPPTWLGSAGRIVDNGFGQPAYALDYGRSLTVGTFTCSMAEDGVRCSDNRTGHGFQLQRSRVDLR